MIWKLFLTATVVESHKILVGSCKILVGSCQILAILQPRIWDVIGMIFSKRYFCKQSGKSTVKVRRKCAEGTFKIAEVRY